MTAAKLRPAEPGWIEEALRTLGTFFDAGDVIEIRALCVGRTENRRGYPNAGYFELESRRSITEALLQVDGKSDGIYFVLNGLNSKLLARSKNKLTRSPQKTTSDQDIVDWRWLYVDIDPARPAGISATNEEHRAALERATEIREFLGSVGWPDPIVGDSGNGGHLLYRLPHLDLKRAADLVKRSLKALAARFSDDRANVDTSTATAARLCKLYGTLTRKGDSTADRPHRRSRLLETPERVTAVPVEALESLAAECPESVGVSSRIVKSSSAPPPTAFDIDTWLSSSGLEIIKGPEPWNSGRRWTLRNCAFNGEHQKPVVIQFESGALVYRCLHRSCAENGWRALRQLQEPTYQGEPDERDARVDAPSAASEPAIRDLSEIPSVFSLESRLDWQVEGMIARGSVNLISAESGTGKTWLGYYIAGRVANALPVLGLPTTPSKVLYLDGENPLYVVKQRLVDLGVHDTPDLRIWGGWNTSPPVGPDHPLVVEFARQHKGLILFDSLIEFHTGSEQSSTETRTFMRNFRHLANLGASCVVLHHTGKADSSKQYRGSSDIKAAVDTAYLLARQSQNAEDLGVLSLNCFKARLAPGKDFGMKFEKGGGFTATEPIKEQRSAHDVIAEILKESPGLNQSQITNLALQRSLSKSQIEKCLKDGPWSRIKGLNNSTLYSLPEERSDE